MTEAPRLYRFGHHFPESGLFNTVSDTEFILEPHLPKGICKIKTVIEFGCRKYYTQVGLGLPQYPGAIYPRHDLAEILEQLTSISETLAPRINDVLIGWINPTDFTYVKNGRLSKNAEESSAPRNIAHFPGKKILLVGDTHHNPFGLQEAIKYVQQERWDLVFLAHQPSHIEWFRWILGANSVFHYNPQIPPERMASFGNRTTPPSQREDSLLCFYGSDSHLHPHRSRVMRELETNHNTIFERKPKLPTNEWCKSLAKHGFVASGTLNNNISTFQIYSILGGCVVFTDGFYSESGMGKLIKDMHDVILYTSSQELADVYTLMLNNERLADRIAAQGRSTIEHYFVANAQSNSWLDCESIDDMIQRVKLENNHLEGAPSLCLKWSSNYSYIQDLKIYSIIHDLSVFHKSIGLIADVTVSNQLIQAIRQQLPRVSITALLNDATYCHELIVFLAEPPMATLHSITKHNISNIIFLISGTSQNNPITNLYEKLAAIATNTSQYELKIYGKSFDRYDVSDKASTVNAANATYEMPEHWQAIGLKHKM